MMNELAVENKFIVENSKKYGVVRWQYDILKNMFMEEITYELIEHMC